MKSYSPDTQILTPVRECANVLKAVHTQYKFVFIEVALLFRVISRLDNTGDLMCRNCDNRYSHV